MKEFLLGIVAWIGIILLCSGSFGAAAIGAAIFCGSAYLLGGFEADDDKEKETQL